MIHSSGSPFIRKQKQRVICKVYYFSMEELKNIKEEAMKDLSNEIDYISTYDALYAHMIMVIADATQTSFTDKNKIKILQPFNGRSCFPHHLFLIILVHFHFGYIVKYQLIRNNIFHHYLN